MNTKDKLNRFIYLHNTYKDLLETLCQFEVDGNIKEISISQISSARFMLGRVEKVDIIFKKSFGVMLKAMIIEVEKEIKEFIDKNLEKGNIL